jgi:hypothetical protein
MKASDPCKIQVTPESCPALRDEASNFMIPRGSSWKLMKWYLYFRQRLDTFNASAFEPIFVFPSRYPPHYFSKISPEFTFNLQNPKIWYCVTIPKRFSVLPDFTSRHGRHNSNPCKILWNSIWNIQWSNSLTVVIIVLFSDTLEIAAYHQKWGSIFRKTFLKLINIISEAYIQ